MLTLVLAAIGLPCAGASAATVGLNANHSVAVYSGAPGEANRVFYRTGSDPGQYRFEERNPSLTLTTGGAGGACVREGARVVTCTDAKITSFRFALGDGNDVESGGADPGTPPISVDGGTGNDVLGGGTKNDTIVGGDGDDTLNSSPSTNFQSSTDGNDRVAGGAGNDTVRGFDGADNLTGEDGVDDLSGGNENDVVAGGPGNDLVNAGPGDDTLRGGAGDDLLLAGGANVGTGGIPDGSGEDSFSGGDGRDLVLYGGPDRIVVTMDDAAGDGRVNGSEKDNVGSDVEDVTTGAGNDRIIGSSAVNRIESGAGDDEVNGGEGDDTINGGPSDPGNDTLNGGGDDDRILSGPGDDLLAGNGGNDTADGGGGSDTVVGGDGTDTVMGGAGGDTLRGGDGNDTLLGAVPALVGADAGDTLTGGAGDDLLGGGDGDDTLDGGAGADEMRGEEGEDTADYSRRTAPVSVSFDSVANDGEKGEGDNVASDVEQVAGGRGGDTLMGDGRRNELTGGPGEDYIDGGRGDDVIAGGERADVLRSRDGDADEVVCGTGADFVIADAATLVDTDCDPSRVDRGDRLPQIGQSTLVARVSGTLRMSPTGIQRQVPLEDTLVLPASSLVNATGGNVRITGATARGGAQTGTFREGAFRVSQTRGGRPITQLKLAGGKVVKCSAGRAGASAKRQKRRRLFGNATGRFRTRGRHSTATVRGTKWITADRCDGTLTTVRQGSVVVRDFRLRRNVTVKAGRRYLAKAPRRR